MILPTPPDEARDALARAMSVSHQNGGKHGHCTWSSDHHYQAEHLASRLAASGWVVMPRTTIRDAASVLMLTVTNVQEGERPHWCRFTGGRHDATCTGVLRTQDALRAALATEPDRETTP